MPLRTFLYAAIFCAVAFFAVAIPVRVMAFGQVGVEGSWSGYTVIQNPDGSKRCWYDRHHDTCAVISNSHYSCVPNGVDPAAAYIDIPAGSTDQCANHPVMYDNMPPPVVYDTTGGFTHYDTVYTP